MTSLKFFLAGLFTGALILVTQTSYGHRLAGHPRSLRGKLELAKRQVIHDRRELASVHAHGWRLLSPLSFTVISHGWWLGRDVAYRDLLQRNLFFASFGVPAWFYRQAMCVHSHESRDWHQRGMFRGGMQFLFGTWARAGGRGDPADASPQEQIFRAYVIWRQDGGSWREWPNTSRMCGLA